MERFVNSRKSRIRTFVFLLIIAVTVYFTFRAILPWYMITSVVIFTLFAPSLYFVYIYLEGLRGYRDRYDRQGMEMEMSNTMMRVIVLVATIILLYVILNGFLQIFVGIDNPIYPLVITIIVAFATVKLVDYYAGKDMDDYVEHKSKSHRDFVTSLGKAEGMCMSCRKKIDTAVSICPHCGYEQKEIGKDSSYIAES